MASATATRFGLSRGLLGLQYDQINESESNGVSRFEFMTIQPQSLLMHSCMPLDYQVKLMCMASIANHCAFRLTF